MSRHLQKRYVERSLLVIHLYIARLRIIHYMPTFCLLTKIELSWFLENYLIQQIFEQPNFLFKFILTIQLHH
jgi:hypothetical protein